MIQHPPRPEYFFEVSWEVCNKVGGIYTTISTKATTLVNRLGDNLVMIGPDIWRGLGENPEFTEDPTLFKTWREHALAEGLKIKVGRWNIASKPVAVLVDFSPSLVHKDEIFAEFYRDYGVDSLTGKWDYIEPALFGHAAGRVIQSFYDHYLSERNIVVAQFHEWLAGSGVLFLKKQAPAIATVFVTHATVVGRAIAGMGQPLYDKLPMFDGDAKALEFDVKAKHSLEKYSAQAADCFATVSEITARECKYLLQKSPDVITPNGFDDAFLPTPEHFEEARSVARKKLLDVASAMCCRKFGDDTLLIATGGRYEFKNKGLDLFVDTMAALHSNTALTRPVVAFILVPAGHTGPREELLSRMSNPDGVSGASCITTHHLQNEHDDPVLRRLRERQLTNAPNDNVHVIFVPVYLSGNDGVFNLDYYQLLIGFDLTAFPSYYEPWGYTPLESVAFRIPTVTTTSAGFAVWVTSHARNYEAGIAVIPRNDENGGDVTAQMVTFVLQFAKLTNTGVAEARETAFRVSRVALWEQLILQYETAWTFALEKVHGRADIIRERIHVKEKASENLIEFPRANSPRWNRIYIPSVIPEQFAPLQMLSRNLWWSWNEEAEQLFHDVDPALWEEHRHNPIALLNTVPLKRFRGLALDEDFLKRMAAVNAAFTKYMSTSPRKGDMQVAYFCMEFGLHASVNLYSGGLGILAGDYLKEASDQGRNIVGVGLLYRNGYFRQHVSLHGEQTAEREENKFSWMPITPIRDASNNWMRIELSLPGRTVLARIWKMDVGRTALYLLDTDMRENNPADRTITDQLYAGDIEHRLLQELLLGIGGVRMLDVLGIKPDIVHINEGHGAFAGLERVRRLIVKEHLSFIEAIEVVRSTSLFTTHTPIPAGHDVFNEDLLRGYLSHFPRIMNVPWDQIMGLGKAEENNHGEVFSMSNLAIRTCQEVNAVSAIHESVTRSMFSNLWRGYGKEELFIGHVTNGVHLDTWTAPEWKTLYRKLAGGETFSTDNLSARIDDVVDVPRATLFDIKMVQKNRLIERLRARLMRSLDHGLRRPQPVFKALESLKPDTLFIGFARRFIDYKRSTLLFTNPEKLAAIVNNPERPVVIIYAGKAHPNDKAGQDLMKRVVEGLEWAELAGKILFLENYDMELSKALVQGVDVWLNTPVRRMEASGTSGMKASLNGVLNCSVLDGWWAEGYRPGAGWALTEKQAYPNRADQDEFDVETIYNLLESEIIPMYYDRGENGVPELWVERMQKAIACCAMPFTTTRMMHDYVRKYYEPLHQRGAALQADKFARAKQLAEWKTTVVESWDDVVVKETHTYDFEHHELSPGSSFTTRFVVDPGKLSVEDLGLEIVFARRGEDGEEHIQFTTALEARNVQGRDIEFVCDFVPELAGAYQYGFRLFPKHPLLPHRQDFALVRWL